MKHILLNQEPIEKPYVIMNDQGLSYSSNEPETPVLPVVRGVGRTLEEALALEGVLYGEYLASGRRFEDNYIIIEGENLDKLSSYMFEFNYGDFYGPQTDNIEGTLLNKNQILIFLSKDRYDSGEPSGSFTHPKLGVVFRITLNK